MSFNEIVTDIKNDLDNGGADALTNSLETLTDINAVQYKANQTSLNNSFKLLLGAMRSNIRRNRQQITPDMNLNKYLSKLTSILPKDISSKYSTQINRIKNEATGVVVGNAIQQVKNDKQNQIENVIFQQALRQNDVANMNFQRNIMPSYLDNQNAIQRSVRSLKPMLRQKNPTMTGIANIPNSIRYLSKFAAMQKKIPLGQATDMQGLAYIGLQRQDLGNGLERIVPYKQNSIMKTDMPNIPVQFKYHANKTMNSWNKFIENEAKFVQLVNQISTPTDRTTYVEKQFKNLNTQTFAAETLATLVYYYVLIPTERYLKYQRNFAQSEQDFYRNYSVGGYPSINPLLLSNQAGVSICKILLNKTDPVSITTPSLLLDRINVQLKKYVSSINKKQMQKCFQHNQNRRLQTLSFLQASGVQSKVIDNLLSVQDFSSIKKKRFVLNTGYQNNQFVTIVHKITTNSTNQKAVKKWDFLWGSQYICCHDYIWG